METSFGHIVDGQEILHADINLLSDNGAYADDRVLAELLRLAPLDSTYQVLRDRVITNYGFEEVWQEGGLISPGPSGSASLLIRPFRAIVGSETAVGTDAKENWRGIASGYFIPSGSREHQVTIDASAGNNRWDIVYATLSVDATLLSENRYVKDTGGAVSQQNLAVRKHNPVTVSVLKGTEASSPSPPTLSPGGGGTYNIELARIMVPSTWTAASTMSKLQIVETAPVAMLSELMGGAGCRPVSGIGDPDTLPLFSVAPPSTRPNSFLPSTMAGGFVRDLAMDWRSGAEFVAGGTLYTLDDRIDWRKRRFLWFASLEDTPQPYWAAGTASSSGTPGKAGYGKILGLANLDWGMGQSFKANVASEHPSLSQVVNASSAIAYFDPGSFTDLDQAILVYVDQTTGKLMATCSTATVPGMLLYMTIFASGQFHNNEG